MEKKVGIIDEPVASGGEDSLDINVHAEALTRYVRLTNTPITIGIQGEWGSGKTSLINSIYHEFDSSQEYKQIWINSWEYSLLSTPEESLLKIVNRIIDELLDADKNKARKDKIQNGAKKIFSGALRVGAQLALGSEAAAVAGELMSGGEASIGALRSQLSELVLEIEKRDTNPYKKIIIYVDDLDRIEPKNAVAILELLKNIFSVPNCVFILAIDYQVVVKGLEHKFGKQTPENEWEFRAFFDKIIQLPFMMPMGQYNIGKYVNKLLVDIGFIDGNVLDEQAIKEIIFFTIGGNPRSIKRLVNSVSLIQIFTNVKMSKEISDSNSLDEQDKRITEEKEKFLLFSLLCLQIAYPAIYSLLNIKPDFTSWNDDFAFSETKKKEESEPEFETEFNNAKQTEDFDEEWEQSLFRICYIRPRLKLRSAEISKFFSYIKDDLLEGSENFIGEIITDILTQTSVTSITTNDQAQPIQNTERFKRTMFVGIDDWEKQYLEKYKGKTISTAIQNSVDIVKFIHDVLIKSLVGKDFEMKYSKTGGCTCYSIKNKNKKFLAISLSGALVKIEILKDFGLDYKIPKIIGLNTTHIRVYDPEKPFTAAFGEQYCISSEKKEDFVKNFEIIETLVLRSFIIAQDHYDKILKIYTVTEDQNILNDQREMLNPDYTYDLN